MQIASSRLLTSYALPPQSTFTCPPASTRTKVSKSQVERRTYVSTSDPAPQLSLFRESSEGPASSTSTTATRNLEKSSKPILFLGTIASGRQADALSSGSDLLAVRQDGSISCFDGEDLKDKWNSPASALVRDDHAGADDTKVEFAQLTNAHSASLGLLKGRQDILAIFGEEISEDGFNPELLILITKSSDSRSLRVVSMPRRSAVGTLQQSVESLLAVELPAQDLLSKDKVSYSLQASSGFLQQLAGDRLHTFDLTNTLPKITSKLRSSGAQSFLRLSNTSVMVSTESTITVYNPKYQSVLATLEIDSSKADTLKRKRGAEEIKGNSNSSCEFVSFFPKLGSAVAISGNNLIALQVEGQVDRQGRPRAAGLLIDSLGCSAKDQFLSGRPKRSKTIIDHELKTLDLSHLATNAGTEASWAEEISDLESAVKSGEASTFDELLSAKLNITWPSESTTNGTTNSGSAIAITKSQDSKVSTVNKRRWVSYALNKIFALSHDEEGNQPALSVAFYPPNTFTWLLREGVMTVSNIETALKSKNTLGSSIQPGSLVDVLEEIDPSMDLLLVLVSQNHLGAEELLHAIKRLMSSLGLFGETASKQAQLTNDEDSDAEVGDSEEQLLRLEVEAENDLAMAEYQLDSGSGVRGQALSVALSKLYTCPNNAIIYAIQTSFTTGETVSLIYLLRFELGRGAWTSRYLDIGESSIIDEDADIPNNAIILIASLLNNCIDAIGAGGWLTGEARLVNGDPFEAQELITSLKLEVGAALEGIEEAKYLNGLISEMVRYGDQVQKVHKRRAADSSETKRKNKPTRPIAVPVGEQEKMLPLGLKAGQLISFQRVGAGGEVQERTMRDIGHLKSQKVGKYTLERIVV